MKNAIIAILSASVWISISEFFRNEYLLKGIWTSHYEGLGLNFPDEPTNGAIWGIWSIAFACFIFFISRKYSLPQTLWISWLGGFVLMWLVTGNMLVLPLRILPFAIPLSLLETGLAAWIILKISLPKIFL